MSQNSSKLRGSKPASASASALSAVGKPGGTDTQVTITPAQLIELKLRILQASKAKVGAEHPETLECMYHLGRAYHGDLKVEKALQVFQEVLPLSERVLGPDNVNTIAALDAVAEELCNLGRYEECLNCLINLRKRYERSTGKESERSLEIGIDIASIMKLLDRDNDALMVLTEVIQASIGKSNAKQHFAKAAVNDLRRLRSPDPPDTKEWERLLRLNDVTIPTEIFPNTSSTSFAEMFTGKGSLPGTSSIGYEATIAVMLRLRSVSGGSMVNPPVHIPPEDPDVNKISLVPITEQGHVDNSFTSLIERSIAALPETFGNENQTAQQVASRHIAFLRDLRSLEELLGSTQHLFWFFQRRQSFMEHQRIPQWNPNCLDHYVLLPVEGGFVNSEDCIFVSHYWQTPENPDPMGAGLSNLQKLLRDGFWSKAQYIWVDWTCLPQGNRTASEQQYFSRALQTIPRLVRECSFMAAFEEFRPRIWVIFEVASYILDRDRGTGLPCTDTFKVHLLQMKGIGVRTVLEKYKYTCSSKDDYELVVSWLEILLALYKTTPSRHTRRHILDAIDNPTVRACTHKEADVVIDKERGTLKAKGNTVMFNPFHTDDSTVEISTAGDFEARLKKAYQRAAASFDDAGVSEIAREYDRMGDYKLGEALHRLAVAKNDTYATSHSLIENLAQQELYDEALALVKRDSQKDNSYELQQKSVMLPSKKAQLRDYRQWMSQPLEKIIEDEAAGKLIQSDTVPKSLRIRPGLRRDFLQRLDTSIWVDSLDPIWSKSTEESCQEMEDTQDLVSARLLCWTLLKRRKESLGPLHSDTRRSLVRLASILRKLNQIFDAHMVYGIALSICDLSLGPLHPESRAVLASLAEVCLLEKKPGVARGYFRQLLERSLAVASWNSDETCQAKYFMQALIPPNCELQIEQLEESATVQIAGYNSRPPQWDWPKNGDGGGQQQGQVTYLIDLDDAHKFLSRQIIAR